MKTKTTIQIHDEVATNKYHGIFVDESDNVEWVRVSEMEEIKKKIYTLILAKYPRPVIVTDIKHIFDELSQSNLNIVESEAPKRSDKLSNPDDSSQGLINSESTNTSGRDTLDLGDFIYFNGRKIK